MLERTGVDTVPALESWEKERRAPERGCWAGELGLESPLQEPVGV